MRRPDVFTLDYGHPLAHGLVRAYFPLRGFFVDVLDNTQVQWILNPSVKYDTVLSQNYAVAKVKYLTPCDYISISADFISYYGIGIKSILCADKAFAPEARLFQACVNSDKINFIPFNANSLVSCTGDTSVDVGKKYSYCGTYDGSNAKVWLDGKLDGSASLSGPLRQVHASATPILFGYEQYQDNYIAKWDGEIGHVLVHNRALSPAEIAILADRTDPMLGGLIVEERPVLYFDMGGSTVNDLTPQNIATDSPVITSPAIGQVHVLTAQGVVTDAPTVTTATLGQIHVLGGDGVALGSPTITTPVLTVIDANTIVLTGQDIVSGAADISTPAIGQVHALVGQDIVAGAPTITIESEKVKRGGGGYTEAPAKAAKPTKQQARKKPTAPKVIEFTRETEAEKQAELRRILTAPIVDEAPTPQVTPQVQPTPSPFLVPSPAQTIDPLVIRQAADLYTQEMHKAASEAQARQQQAEQAQEMERIAMMRMRDEDESESLIMIFANV